mgnify:CR=1 FL=1
MERGETIVASVLTKKQERYDALRFDYVHHKDSYADATEIPKEHNISQLLVGEDIRGVGGVTDTALMDIETSLADMQVLDRRLPHFPEVPVTENGTTVRGLLDQNVAVLLTESDINEFSQLSAPT